MGAVRRAGSMPGAPVAGHRCFRAAIGASIRAGIRPPGASAHWGPDFVSSRFNGELINRRKHYASDLRFVERRLGVAATTRTWNTVTRLRGLARE
ncbi:MAG: hypothetical protein M3N47_04375 [Chloroflexota bacterium]|nr:hypothetical protein [Chloroflexota bacterium]